MLATVRKPSLEIVTANLIRSWLLKMHKCMLMDFLDKLEIQHKDGVVDELPKTIDDVKLQPAVDLLLSKYPQEVVAVYLNLFSDINEVEWTNLKKMLETDKRLQLGG